MSLTMEAFREHSLAIICRHPPLSEPFIINVLLSFFIVKAFSAFIHIIILFNYSFHCNVYGVLSNTILLDNAVTMVIGLYSQMTK